MNGAHGASRETLCLRFPIFNKAEGLRRQGKGEARDEGTRMREMRCPKCKTDKPEKMFQRIRRGKVIQYSKCRPCLRAESKHRKFFRKQRGATYESRNAILRAIGFSNYAEYLKSDLWKRIRAKVFRVKGRTCMLCGEPADVPHHNRYHRQDLLGWTLKYINPICNRCHHGIEFDDGEKVPLKTAAESYRRLRRGGRY